MAARYGTDRPRRGGVALAVVVGVVFVAIVGYVTWRLAAPAVQANVIRFTDVSDTEAEVTFEVHRTGSSATTCVIRAQGIDHADVGYATTVTITPGRDYVQLDVPLATSSRPLTVEVLGADDGPPRVDGPQFVPARNPPQVPTSTAPDARRRTAPAGPVRLDPQYAAGGAPDSRPRHEGSTVSSTPEIWLMQRPTTGSMDELAERSGRAATSS
jgi:hypothetical protein